jgi:hypothetical protein
MWKIQSLYGFHYSVYFSSCSGMAILLRFSKLHAVAATSYEQVPILALDTRNVDYVATRDRTINDIDGALDRFSIKDGRRYTRLSDLPPRSRVPLGLMYRPHIIGQVHTREKDYSDNPLTNEVCIPTLYVVSRIDHANRHLEANLIVYT